ncbi:MAG: potassium-transporting ATPase subunit F [Acidobacteriota bacterium]|nr:potassium-transporting ATPase subunit F [Acidobacteriota bacterium]
MTLFTIAVFVLAVCVTAYLFFTLLFPEKL